MRWGPAASKNQYQKTIGPLKKSWCTHFAWVLDCQWEVVINGEDLYVFVVKGFLSKFNEIYPESRQNQHKLASHHFPPLTHLTVCIWDCKWHLHLILRKLFLYTLQIWHTFAKRLPSYTADFEAWMGANRFRNSKDTTSFISIILDLNIVGPDLSNSSP